MNVKNRAVSLLILLAAAPLWAALKSDPQTFDFGWAPDNARIICEFTIKNTGGDAIGLQAVKPACGCTAAQFTPMSLASDAETKVGLTFNTRGYKGYAFDKPADLVTEANTANITVRLKGHVLNPNAKFAPTGTGIASFEPETKSNSQKITLQNKSDKDLKLAVVQSPASWAKIKFGADTIKAGQSADLTVQMSGSFDQVRETSFTIEATGDAQPHRATIAVRTGPPQKAYQPLRPARGGDTHNHSPKQSGGYSDPLKLKPIEPVKSK